ncbi:XRE family transcriptional regulator [Candidatus Poriferisocius sp.]|uniref:XRE family transcriptional regulator n=1 Tax=Candidatus Poriferisocius sp. TaxID=3101276 RepID=UPI003B52156E
MTNPTRPAVPVDDASIEDVPDSAWQQDDSLEQFYEMLAESPIAVEAFNKLAEEISARQSTLAQVRRARKLTQKVIGMNLDMDQSAVSRLEHRSDILLSTLRSFIQATGGDLHLIVTYPDSSPVSLQIGPKPPDYVIDVLPRIAEPATGRHVVHEATGRVDKTDGLAGYDTGKSS